MYPAPALSCPSPGLAIKRYPELELVFGPIGVDINVAKSRVASVELNGLPPPQIGDVQKGLLV